MHTFQSKGRGGGGGGGIHTQIATLNVGACVLSLIFKLWKSIKTFNNILKLPDLCLRLSRSSFFTPFLVRDGV